MDYSQPYFHQHQHSNHCVSFTPGYQAGIVVNPYSNANIQTYNWPVSQAYTPQRSSWKDRFSGIFDFSVTENRTHDPRSALRRWLFAGASQ